LSLREARETAAWQSPLVIVFKGTWYDHFYSRRLPRLRLWRILVMTTLSLKQTKQNLP